MALRHPGTLILLLRCTVLLFAALQCAKNASIAQNLIPNPSFEQGTPYCGVFVPVTFDSNCSDWTTPTIGSPDVYHASLSTSCPNATFGSTHPYSWGEEVPLTGDAFAAVITYCSICPTEEREYAQAQLTEPLQVGVEYHAEMWVSLGDRCDFATNGIGLYFSVNPPSSGDWTSLPGTPQVWSASTVAEQEGWTLISGEFVADAAHAYVTIGSFLNDAQMTVVPTGSNTMPFACYFVEDILVEQYFPPLTITGDTLICEGGSATLLATNGTNVHWALSSAPWITIGMGDTLVVQPVLNSTYLAISETDTATFSVVVIPDRFAELGPDAVLCEGDTLTLTVDHPEAMTLWSTGEAGPTIDVTDAGVVWVSSMIGSCNDTDTIMITVRPPPALWLPADTLLCPSTPLILDATVPDGMYRWSDGSNDAMLPVNEAGTYSVTVDDGVCTIHRTITVTGLVLDGFALSNTIDACYGDSVRWDVSLNGATYTWDDGSTMPVLAVGVPGIRTVEIQVQGCVFSVVCDVRYSYCAPSVRLPNVFSPNGDGLNDSFLPIELRDIASAQLTVFDRWGNEQFFTNDLRTGWRASGAPEGTYYWTLSSTDVNGVQRTQHGTVTLLR